MVDGGVDGLPGEYLARGRTAELYAYGESDVLKLLLPGFGAEMAQREAELGKLLHALGAPVPAVRGTVEVNGRGGVIFERVHGESLLVHLMRNPWRVARHARTLA